MPWLNLTRQLQAVVCNAFDTRSHLRRIHPEVEGELTGLAGGDSNDQHLIRIGDKHFTPEIDCSNLVTCFSDRVVKLEFSTILRHLIMSLEVQPQITKWLIRHEHFRFAHHGFRKLFRLLNVARKDHPPNPSDDRRPRDWCSRADYHPTTCSR